MKVGGECIGKSVNCVLSWVRKRDEVLLPSADDDYDDDMIYLIGFFSCWAVEEKEK